jgi:Neuraminidase (sialidase)
VEYSDVVAGVLRMVTSADGGQTWHQATAPRCPVVGGVPVVQPNGTVVVPIHSNGGRCGDQIEAFVSTDGGTTYHGPYKIATTVPTGGSPGTHHIAATVGSSGRVYVTWSDCRFRANCGTNDLVMSTSTDGQRWTPVSRIRIPGESRTVDHFIPGLAADPSVSNGPAHLALVYYDYPIADCSASSCLLDVAMTTSADAGTTWTRPTTLAGPMKPEWLANTDQGRMVGDYISTSYSGGVPFPMFAVARRPNGRGVFDESIYTARTSG